MFVRRAVGARPAARISPSTSAVRWAWMRTLDRNRRLNALATRAAEPDPGPVARVDQAVSPPRSGDRQRTRARPCPHSSRRPGRAPRHPRPRPPARARRSHRPRTGPVVPGRAARLLPRRSDERRGAVDVDRSGRARLEQRQVNRADARADVEDGQPFDPARRQRVDQPARRVDRAVPAILPQVVRASRSPNSLAAQEQPGSQPGRLPGVRRGPPAA